MRRSRVSVRSRSWAEVARVAQVELHDAVARHVGAHPQRAALRIHAEDVADQEVARQVFARVGAHRHAEEQRLAEQLAVGRRQSLEQARQHFARRAAVELADQVLVRHRDEHRLADRPAALRDDGVELDVAGQRERHAARVVDLVAEIQRRAADLARAAREAADLRRERIDAVEAADERLGLEAVGIGEQQERRLLIRRHPQRVFPDARFGEHRRHLRGVEVRALELHARQQRAGQRQARPVFDLAAAADHAAGATAEQEGALELAQQQLRDCVEARRMVGADEDEQQIGFLAAEAGEDGAGGTFHGRAQVAIGLDC